VLYFYKEDLGQPLSNVDGLRAKRPVHERHAPSVADTCQLLQTIRNVGGYSTNLIARLLYGCGLRVQDKLHAKSSVRSLSGISHTYAKHFSALDRICPGP
jgi:hypothetical protein